MGVRHGRWPPLVPQDHFYRHVERTLDLSFVREFVQETYAGGGRMVEFFGMWVPVRQSHLVEAVTHQWFVLQFLHEEWYRGVKAPV